jgi:hypothetical protein
VTATAVLKLKAGVADLIRCLDLNRDSIPNYAQRYRSGKIISTTLVESAVNQVVRKRMIKKPQMRWSRWGAQLLLNVRTQVLNGELQRPFRRWYPEFASTITRWKVLRDTPEYFMLPSIIALRCC